MARGLPVMILTAGLGTRLRPLSAWRAKPLVPVGDRPVLGHVLERVAPVAARVVVNAHHRAEDVRAFAAESSFAPLVSDEPALLGTAGGVARAAPLLGDGAILVWNGDVLADLDAVALVAAHAAHAAEGVQATLAVRAAGPAGAGNVGLDARGDVVRLRAETTRPGEARGAWFLGVHVLGPELRAAAPAAGCLVGDVHLPALRTGARIAAWDHTGAFVDVGTLPEYLGANLAWLGAREAHVPPGARVDEEVALRRVVLGEGATVEGCGSLEDVVVWPGGRAVAPLRRAVVAPEGTVRVPAP